MIFFHVGREIQKKYFPFPHVKREIPQKKFPSPMREGKLKKNSSRIPSLPSAVTLNKPSTFCVCFEIIVNAMTWWFDFVTISSFIDQSTMFSAIFVVANVKSSTDCEIFECDVYVISSDVLINSQLNLLIHEINASERIEFWIFEFYHEWCALKSSQIIAFWRIFIHVNFRSIVYFWFSPWDFSL